MYLFYLMDEAVMSYHKLSGAHCSCKNEEKKWPVPLVWAGGRKVLGKSHPHCGLKVT